MSTLVCLMDALNASRLAAVPIVPNVSDIKRYDWVQGNDLRNSINTGSAEIVLNAPSVPIKLSSVIDKLEIKDEHKENLDEAR